VSIFFRSPTLMAVLSAFVPNQLVVVHMQVGSHLYGLNSANSDTDWKVVYVPSLEDLLLGRISHVLRHSTAAGANTCTDVDTEIYSLHKFVDHALEGAAFALDMLHAPTSMIMAKHPLWDILVRNKHPLYTKGFPSAMSFVRSALLRAQSVGYATTKAISCDLFMDVFSAVDPSTRFADLWDVLPRGNGLPLVMWPRSAHAVRVADELKELYETGGITLPLPSRATVMAIKLGHTPFAEVEALLTARVAELEVLAAASKYPMAPGSAQMLYFHRIRFSHFQFSGFEF